MQFCKATLWKREINAVENI